jgi:hypothetical protein
MIKGLAIGSPIQCISIGRVVEKNGKRLQEKDEQFTITSQVQNRDGWVIIHWPRNCATLLAMVRSARFRFGFRSKIRI